MLGFVFLYFICLLFNLKVKSVSTTTTVCASSLCITHRTNSCPTTRFKTQKMHRIKLTKWPGIVIETCPEHCK